MATTTAPTAALTQDQILLLADILSNWSMESELPEHHRDFVTSLVIATIKNEWDEGLKMAHRTIGRDFLHIVDGLVIQFRYAVKSAATNGRYAQIKAAGKTPCHRCSATGTYINGGTCYGCEGHGHR
jgi:hypothetical protein